jgi:hypothetical protein
MGDFLNEVRRLEWAFADGLWAPAIVDHTNTRFDFAGATYAPFDDMLNGYTVEFSGVATRVDLLGSNNDLIDVLNPTGVSVVPSNSAGLQIVETGSGLSAEQTTQLANVHGTVRRCVWVNTEALINGNGYQQTPFNNWTDAVDYNEANGLTSIFLTHDAVIDRQIKDFEIFGVGLPAIDLNAQIINHTTFRLCNLTGTQGGGAIVAFDCQMTDVVDFNGAGSLVGGVGTIAFANGGSTILNEVVPFSAGAEVTLSLTLGGAATTVSIEKCSGHFKVTNMDHVDDLIHIALEQGSIEIDSSCTAGEIHIMGTGYLIDNSAGATINKETWISTTYVNKKLLTKSYFTALS